MNVVEFLGKHVESNNTAIQKLEAEILKLKMNSANKAIVTSRYLMVKHNLEIALNKAGLTVLEETGGLNEKYICLRFASLNGKFKFVPFDGYTKSGAGRNHDRLVAKSEKVGKIVFQATGFECRINHYSLECAKEDQVAEKTIHCDLIIPTETIIKCSRAGQGFCINECVDTENGCLAEKGTCINQIEK